MDTVRKPINFGDVYKGYIEIGPAIGVDRVIPHTCDTATRSGFQNVSNSFPSVYRSGRQHQTKPSPETPTLLHEYWSYRHRLVFKKSCGWWPCGRACALQRLTTIYENASLYQRHFSCFEHATEKQNRVVFQPIAFALYRYCATFITTCFRGLNENVPRIHGRERLLRVHQSHGDIRSHE